MRISSDGLTLSYHGDKLLWLWPWRRGHNVKYYSHVFDLYFLDLRDYWQYVGAWNEACRKEKIEGFSELEVFKQWGKQTFLRQQAVILLRNVNVEMRSTKFWKSVNGYARRQLLKDIVVLYFGNALEAQPVMQSIPPEFAEAYLFVKGELITSNNENSFKQDGEADRSDNPGPR